MHALHRLPPVELPPISDAAIKAVEAALGDDWDDDRLTQWLAADPTGSAQQLKAWGALDMQFHDEDYGCGGWTPLMLATVIEDPTQRLTAVNALLDAGASVALRTPEGSSVLVIAMMTGDVAVLQRLLDAGADPNVPTCVGITPLHHVGYAIGGIDPMVTRVRIGPQDTPAARADALLRAGAHPNAATLNDRTTPLQMLMGMGADPSTIDRLVQGGADLQVRVAKPLLADRWREQVMGDTLLHLAVRDPRTTPDVVRHLIDLGVDPHALNAREDNALGALMGASWPGAGTLQFDEMVDDRRALVQALLDAGVDPNARDLEGWSPWLRLVDDVVRQHERGREQLTPEVLAMVQAGADLSAPWPIEDDRVKTCRDRLHAMSALDDAEKAHWIERLELLAAARSVEAQPAALRDRARL